MSNEYAWYPQDWPEDGCRDTPQAMRIANEVRKVETPYRGEQPPFCFPGTVLDVDVLEMARFLQDQINHIGTHTHPTPAEGGFVRSQKMEASAISMIASVCGNADGVHGDKGVDGYFCGGATEATIEGLWIGREYVRDAIGDEPMAIVCTRLTHYSVFKAANLLGIARHRLELCERCGQKHRFISEPERGIAFTGMNERGEMDPASLAETLRRLRKEGIHGFIVVPTVGTTTLGSIDPVAEIAAVVRGFSEETAAPVYLHVDAAFGGFTVPFFPGAPRFGFDIPEVQSIALDGDKMGRLPYPAGVFLCRKGYQEYIATPVTYIAGHNDDTVSGSRSCIAPLYAWLLYQREGRAGQRAYVQKCLDEREKLIALITEKLPWAEIKPYSPYVSILPVRLPMDKHLGRIPDAVANAEPLAPYPLAYDFLPSNPADPDSCPEIVYKLVIMPHNIGMSEQFVTDLAAAHAASQK